MYLKLVLSLGLAVLLWLPIPIKVHGLPLTSESPVIINSEAMEIRTDENKSVQPLKSYILTLLPGGSRFSVNIRPPATKIAVTLLSGDTAVRCGDRFHNYSCIPGKRLEISAAPTNAIAQFWGENAYQSEMRLRIDVYEVSGDRSQRFANRLASSSIIFPKIIAKKKWDNKTAEIHARSKKCLSHLLLLC